jgi:phospholipid/cholesterol/gamma-HCH transport system permease protein
VVEAFGSLVTKQFGGAGAFVRTSLEGASALVRQTLGLKLRREPLFRELYSASVQSLPVIGVGLLFLSLMLITEFSFHMKLVLRQDSLVPAFSTLLMVRELGPVVTALLLTSRVGAGMAAEIATQKATEQLDALRLLSLDPVEFLVPPRWIASVFATLSLTLVALAIGILGGACLAALVLGYGVQEFFNTMFVFARLSDLFGCALKAVVFGSILPLVAVHHGLRSKPGSSGVGDAATGAVVQGSVLIIIADFVLTYWLYG